MAQVVEAGPRAGVAAPGIIRQYNRIYSNGLPEGG